jgi:hypothetical protein
MLLQQSNQEVIVNGADEESSSFSIAMNGKAFRVLSSTLYQDKIGSIVREISTNALDAHVMAGKKDQPFVIHVPDEFEPWFSVKDFGVGLSDSEIKNVYTKYFQSTKDQSNDTTGAFGLGSKTPFSYTDQFTVTSVKEGHLFIYSAYLTPNGVPSIQLMHSEETNEPNGVEVKLSVKCGDYHKFAQKCIEQLRFFPVAPTFENVGEKFGFPEKEKPLIEGATFSVYKGVGNTFMIQGPVGYPFDFDNYKNVSSNTVAVSFANLFLNRFSIEMTFNIGDIGVTASRESVEYTEETVKMIDSKFLEIKAKMEDRVKNQFINLTNWQIACESNSFDIFGDINVYNPYFKDDDQKPVSRYGSFHFVIAAGKASVFEINRISKKPRYHTHIDANERVNFVIEDDCKYKKARQKELLNIGRSVYIVQLNAGVTEQDFRSIMGGYHLPIKKLSEVPYTPPVRVKGSSVKSNCWKHNGYSNIREWEKLNEFPQDEEVCYVLVDNLSPLADQNYCENLSKRENLARFGINPLDLYAVREKDHAKFVEANPEAKMLKDWVAETIEENKIKMVSVVKNRRLYECLHPLFNNQRVASAIVVSGDVRLNRLLNIWTNKAKLHSNFRYVEGMVGDLVNKSFTVNQIRKLVKKEIESRPILELLNNHDRNKITEEALAKYVSVIV